MKMPWALKIDILLAILSGTARAISFENGEYRIELPATAVGRWKRRNARRRAGKRSKGGR